MACKNGQCSRTTKDKHVVKALDTLYKSKKKVSFDTIRGEVTFSAAPRPNKPGIFTTEKAKKEAFTKGIMVGGIVSAIIFSFFL